MRLMLEKWSRRPIVICEAGKENNWKSRKAGIKYEY